MLELAALGQRIMILGPSSSGKSTLANALGRKLNCPCHHLDLMAHIPNTQWLRKPDEEFVADHARAIAADAWVIDGNYSVCMPARTARATAIIWLDYSPWYSAVRFIKRSLFGGLRHGKLEGAKDSLNLELIKHTLFKYPKNREKYISLLAQYPQLPLVRICSISELESYYKYWGIIRI